MKDSEYLEDWSCKITPCTTVPTSPNVEKIRVDFKVYAKMKLIQEFEQKIFSLQEIVANKILNINQRMVAVQNKDRQNATKRYKIEEKSQQAQRISFESNDQDLSQINETLYDTVTALELKNKAANKNLEDFQEKLSEYSLVQQLTERRISDISRSLLTLYREKQERTEDYRRISFEKKKIHQASENLSDALTTLTNENFKIKSKQASIEKKKILLSEKLALTEKQKIRVFKLKFIIDSEKSRINDTLNTLNEVSNRKTKLYEKIKEKIILVENLAEVVQAKEKFLDSRHKKIQNDSRRVFQTSREIFELLKLLDTKNSELERELVKSEIKEKTMKKQYFNARTNQELEDKQKGLLEKLQKLRNQEQNLKSTN